MRHRLPSLLFLTAGLVATAAPAFAVTPDPARQLEDWARKFRQSDVSGLVQAIVPPARWEEMRLMYELKSLDPISEKERAEFAEKLERFTGPNAVEDLMLEIEPELEKARPQAQGAILMAFGAAQMAIASPDSKLTEEQRATYAKALPGLHAWATNTDFLNSDTLREALTLVTQAARNTGIQDIDQLKALPLEAALDRASPVLAAAKQAVRLYGLDLDAVADSLRVDVLEIGEETARVRATITLFDAPVFNDFDLVLVEGRWYGKQHVIHFNDRRHDAEVEAEIEAQIEAELEASEG